MTSFVFTPYTIAASLQAVNQLLKESMQWHGKTSAQIYFLEKIMPIAQKDINKIPEIEAQSSQNVREINKFLQDRGFSVQLDEFPPGISLKSIATASILKIIFEWIEDGILKSFPANHRIYEGVSMADESLRRHKTFTIYDLSNILTQLVTKTEDLVYLMVAPDPPLKNFDLLTFIQNIMNDVPKIAEKAPIRNFELIFPKINLTYTQPIEWLEHLSTPIPEPYFIAQAMEQTTMKVDEKGGQVKTAITHLIITGVPMPIVINRPFYLWLCRKGLTFPVFIAYLDYDSWCVFKGKQQIPFRRIK